MKDIPEFKIDDVGSAASALSLNDLRKLGGGKGDPIDSDVPLTYAPSLGSLELRQRLAEIFATPEAPLTEDNVLITPGSIMANYLVLATTCTKGDHVICQFPTYGQLYLLPKYFGAEVDLWVMREDKSWIPDIEQLKQMIKPNTKAIILNNPSNPTGTTLPKETLEQIRDLARVHNVTIIGDEVFRPLFHGGTPTPPSVISLGYTKTVITGSVSKAYSLPGIRIGWVISPDTEILKQVTVARDYTTLNVSRVDDAIALFALAPNVLPKILARNLETGAANIKLIDEFVNRNSDRCRWIRPTGAGTAFIQLLGLDGQPVDEAAFADRLIDETATSVIPGGLGFGEPGVADFKGYLRLNLSYSPKLLEQGLKSIQLVLKKY
ncbi:hypothetical protein FDECE_11363 [Fusarium decemcellulare]|nr:hypothetical protein FDECE_11363 [Fusarium decemcellulare]